MKLRYISRVVLESAKSDLFDIYLLLASPYLHEPDNMTLLRDRVDRFLDFLSTKLWHALLYRPQVAHEDDHYKITQAEKPIYDKTTGTINYIHTGQIDGFDGVSWEDLKKVKDAPTRFKILKKLDEHDKEAYPDGYYYTGSWYRLIDALWKLMNPPRGAIQRAYLIDQFLGMTHNHGNITDYMGEPWLLDALYVRALAEPNELAQHASHDVVKATRSAATGIGFTPVTKRQKYDLFLAKKQRNHDLMPPLNRDDTSSWIYGDFED